MWETVVDLAGTTLTGWTSLGGTWAANAGGYIEQSSTTGAYRGLRLDASVYPGSGLVGQADMRFPTGGSADSRAFLALLGSGDISGHSPWAGLRTTGSTTYIQRGDQATYAGPAFTLNRDTWYTVRVEYAWHTVTISVDGTRLHTQRVMVPTTQESEDSRRLSLITYSGGVHYRNIKVWRLAGPT